MSECKKSDFCKWEPAKKPEDIYTCINKTTGKKVDDLNCDWLTKPNQCEPPTISMEWDYPIDS